MTTYNKFISVNNFSTTLVNDVSSYDDTIVIASDADTPTLTGGLVWALRLTDAATRTAIEIVYVTDIAGATLTVERAQEGTSALDWAAGDIIFATPTVGSVQFVKDTVHTFDVSGDSDVTLNDADMNAAILEFTGALTGNINIDVPAEVSQFTAINNTTGAYSLTVKSSAGGSVGVSMQKGSFIPLVCDGVDVLTESVPSSLFNGALTAYTVGTDRVNGATYYNTNPLPIMVYIGYTMGVGAGGSGTITVNGVNILNQTDSTAVNGQNRFASFVVPAGGSYRANMTGDYSLSTWAEQA